MSICLGRHAGLQQITGKHRIYKRDSKTGHRDDFLSVSAHRGISRVRLSLWAVFSLRAAPEKVQPYI